MLAALVQESRVGTSRPANLFGSSDENVIVGRDEAFCTRPAGDSSVLGLSLAIDRSTDEMQFTDNTGKAFFAIDT